MSKSLYYSRRLILLAALLPALSAALIYSWPVVVTVAILGILAAILILGLWPAATIDTISMSLAASVAIPLYAGIAQPFWHALLAGTSTPAGWFWLVITGGAIYLWLGIVRLVALTEKLHAGTLRNRFEGQCDLTVEEAAEALILRPGQTLAGRRAGPVEADGFFDVSFEVDTVDLTDFSPKREALGYRMRIVEEEVTQDGGLRVLVHTTVTDSLGVMRSSMAENTFTPCAGGTHFQLEEVHDVFNRLAQALFWLDDAQAHWFQSSVEIYKSKSGETLYPSQGTLLTTLARFFVVTGLAPKNDRGS